ncbi:MAG: hypothetical protein RL734_1805 [Bacteroidota bacterium]
MILSKIKIKCTSSCRRLFSTTPKLLSTKKEGYQSIGSFHSDNPEELIRLPNHEYVVPELPFSTQREIHNTSTTFSSSSAPFANSLHYQKAYPYLHRDEWTFLNHGAFGLALSLGMERADSWRMFLESQPLRYFDRYLLDHLLHSARCMVDFCSSTNDEHDLLRLRESVALLPNVTSGMNAVIGGHARCGDNNKIFYFDVGYGSNKRMCEAYHGKNATVIPFEEEFLTSLQRIESVTRAENDWNEASATVFLRALDATIQKEISKAIIGQQDIIEQLLISLFSRGHCLLVGVPGLAKTLLIRTLSKSLNLTYNRIQFTPDLMPSDITGTEVIEDDMSTGKKQFRFVKGPIFSNIVLADEINRTPPKTQAALLEAMQEHSVTNGGKTYQLEQPFFVLATQNPIEQEGTYPLPEAQLDRFMFNLWLDYPSEQEEAEIVRTTTTEIIPDIKPILSAEDIIRFQDIARKIPVSDNVINYAVSLVRATRPQTSNSKTVKDLLSYGAGPRASQYLVLGAKTRAAMRGAFTPEIDDIRAVAEPVLRHRIVTNFSAEADNITPSNIISMLLKEL